MTKANATTDHATIRKWVEDRGGQPATVGETATDEPGVLRIDFPGYSGEETLDRISWDAFFAKFDESELAFLYQEKTEDGSTSRFCKFVSREEAAKG